MSSTKTTPSTATPNSRRRSSPPTSSSNSPNMRTACSLRRRRHHGKGSRRVYPDLVLFGKKPKPTCALVCASIMFIKETTVRKLPRGKSEVYPIDRLEGLLMPLIQTSSFTRIHCFVQLFLAVALSFYVGIFNGSRRRYRPDTCLFLPSCFCTTYFPLYTFLSLFYGKFGAY